MRRMPYYLSYLFLTVSIGFTCLYGYQVYQGHRALEIQEGKPHDNAYRVVVISDDMGTLSWNELFRGAKSEADKQGMFIDFWGTYRSNEEDVLKYMDIAIASNVDGIIVQGIESTEFNQLVNIKAAVKGIPVITVGTDAPRSLRRTFVGSNHEEEGLKIGHLAARQMGFKGLIGIVQGQQVNSATKLRLLGLKQALKLYPQIQIVQIQDTEASSNEVTNLLNDYPDCKAFISMNASSADQMVRAISQRYRVQDYLLYMFDDFPEAVKWVNSGIVDATLDHDPYTMGELSIQLMQQWLEGKDIPLKPHYYTPIRILDGDKL